MINSALFCMVIMILAGVASMIAGLFLLYVFPNIETDSQFLGEFYFNDEKSGDLQIKFHAPSGLMPTRTVTTNISVTFNESKVNSSKVEMDFPDARVLNSNDVSHIAKEGKIVTFTFDKNDSRTSTYVANSSLTYYYANQYSATLKIISGNYTASKEFGDVVSIGSWNSFWTDQQGNKIQGLTFMIIGVGVIGSAPTFAKLADLSIRRKKLKDEIFYD